MSTLTDITAPETEIDFLTPRELHHAEDLHEGDTASCDLCDRYEIAEYNGYINGITDWYESVGQFLGEIDDSAGVTR